MTKHAPATPRQHLLLPCIYYLCSKIEEFT